AEQHEAYDRYVGGSPLVRNPNDTPQPVKAEQLGTAKLANWDVNRGGPGDRQRALGERCASLQSLRSQVERIANVVDYAVCAVSVHTVRARYRVSRPWLMSTFDELIVYCRTTLVLSKKITSDFLSPSAPLATKFT